MHVIYISHEIMRGEFVFLYVVCFVSGWGKRRAEEGNAKSFDEEEKKKNVCAEEGDRL